MTWPRYVLSNIGSVLGNKSVRWASDLPIFYNGGQNQNLPPYLNFKIITLNIPPLKLKYKQLAINKLNRLINSLYNSSTEYGPTLDPH